MKDEVVARGLSARWLAVVTVAFVIAVTLAPPLQRYFAQSRQINELKTQVKDSQNQLLTAQKQLAQLNDPTFIESQARSRLHYIFPGEKQYVVVGANNQNQTPSAPTSNLANPLMQGMPWYTKLISSFTSANQGIKN